MSAELVSDSTSLNCTVTGFSMFLFIKTVYLMTIGQASRFGDKDAGLLV